MIPCLSVAEAKTHLRVEGDEEDDLILSYIVAAQQVVENATGHWLTERLATATMPDFSAYRVAVYPVDLVSIQYIDTSGAPQSLPTSAFRLFDWHGQTVVTLADGQVAPQLQPGTGVIYTFRAGYSTSPPPRLIQAVKLQVGEWHRNRENTVLGAALTPISLGVEALSSGYIAGRVA